MTEARAMTVETRVGDVFLVPLDEDYCAGGQVVSAWNDELYLAIFDAKLPCKESNPMVVVDHAPVFLALSLDAKIWHGHWPIVGNVRSNLDRFPQPAFKVRQSGVFHIESRDRTLSRPATPKEVEQLLFRTVTSPAGIEAAIKAYFGIGIWHPHYDELLAENAFRSSSML